VARKARRLVGGRLSARCALAAEPQNRQVAKHRLCRVSGLVGVALLPGLVLAWELASRPLTERVNDANVIVVARISVVHSRNPSPIMGVGDVWLVSLRVSKTIKGSPPPTIRVSFVEATVKEWRTFRPDHERLWLLKTSADPTLLTAPAAYESVLLVSDEAPVRAALHPAPRSPPSAPPRR
jgi:hypothetical protein